MSSLPLSADDQERLKSLRTSLSADTSCQNLDGLARWLFGVVAIVGTLGLAFGANGFGDLHGWPRTIFAIATCAVGATLALAVISLVPKTQVYNPNNIGSMELAWTKILRHRARWTIGATSFFVLALGAASIVPLFSSIEHTQRTHLGVSVDEKRNVSATFSVSHAKRFSDVGFIVTGVAPTGRWFPRVRASTDANGAATLTLKLANPAGLARVKVVGYWRPSHEVKRRTVKAILQIGPPRKPKTHK